MSRLSFALGKLMRLKCLLLGVITTIPYSYQDVLLLNAIWEIVTGEGVGRACLGSVSGERDVRVGWRAERVSGERVWGACLGSGM